MKSFYAKESLSITDYVVRNLAKLRYKKYESYVVNRIIHLLDDFSIKFVTQQYVRRSDNKIALTDLFFPQFRLHVEVDEGHHYLTKDKIDHQLESLPKHIVTQCHEDKVREADIINMTGHEIFRINVYKQDDGLEHTLDSIHTQIDNLLKEIRCKKQKLEQADLFKPWNIDKEFNPQTYIDLCEIKLEDNVILKSQKDVCNCFGHDYKHWQRGGASHPYEEDTMIWFPKLYKNDQWDNKITADGMTITEKSIDESTMQQKVIEWKMGKQKRIVFARVKDNLSNKAVYRFMGLFQLKNIDTKDGGTWERISTMVRTYERKK